VDPVSPWAAHRPHDGDEVACARFLSIARLKIAQIARASSTTGLAAAEGWQFMLAQSVTKAPDGADIVTPSWFLC